MTLDIKKRYKKKEIKYEDIIAEYKMTENHFKNQNAIQDQDTKIQKANTAHQQQQTEPEPELKTATTTTTKSEPVPDQRIKKRQVQEI